MEGIAKQVVEEVKAETKSDITDFKKDKDAYDYIFKMYTSSLDLYWKKINMYIVVEAALATTLITMINYKFTNGSIKSLAMIGCLITFYMSVMALIDSIHLYAYDTHASKIESNVIGNNVIFRIDKPEEGKVKNIYQSIADKRTPLAIAVALIWVVFVAWMVIFGIYN